MLRRLNICQGVVFKRQRFRQSEQTKVDVDVHQRKFVDTVYTPSVLREERPYDLNLNRFKTLDLDNAGWKEIHNKQTFNHIPQLEHGLDVVLKGGLHKSNFGISRIPKGSQVDTSQYPPYLLPSNDQKSINTALKHKMKYLMSTSTITSIISHIYFLFSNFRIPVYDNIRPDLVQITRNFMISARKPVTAIITKHSNGLTTFDSDSKFYESTPQVLMSGGKVIQNLLTYNKEDFYNRFLSKEDKSNLPKLVDHHNYLLLNNQVCIRSQIDCKSYDENKKPFFFEIKTRAVAPIRYDLDNYINYLNYNVRSRGGSAESFEREYYDLIRGSFMGYGLQLMIGGMSGAVVGYHNTQKFFGFQYIQAEQIYRRIFGNRKNAQIALVVCTKLLIKITQKITEIFKNDDYKHIRLGLYADNSYHNQLDIFAQLLDELPPKSPEELKDMDISQVKDSIDYYSKLHKIKKVKKLTLKIKSYVNGVQQITPGLNFSEGDQLQVKYFFSKQFQPTFSEYMIFTHEAQKNRDDLRSGYYSGIWYNRAATANLA